MKDLAPTIHRQRLVIEGYPTKIITPKHIREYLLALSTNLKMKTLIKPVTHRSEKYGEAGWIHWESSGAHFYSWEVPLLFFSVDIYTCRPFKSDVAIKFTKEYFDAKEIEFKEF